MSATGNVDPAEDRRAREVGDRLRHVRLQQELSLQDVERLSDGTLKASVVGAYERGERAVSLRRLEHLAGFYRVPVIELLSAGDRDRADVAGHDEVRVVIDLASLERHRGQEPALARFVEAIRVRRGDFGRVLTVRSADLDTLALVDEASPDQLRDRLSEAGIVHRP
ncbi:MAG: helix-turn-helix domain-containing protein [Nitriliruptor sp.]|uniref:helix-turn-helix domain-containing protein n=1 Tax=Nitriliruptor sp. TaxID=2448056 RepID=UPI00349FF5A9